MRYEPNNKLVGTKSNKIYRESKILNYVCKKLDSNQDIKRFLHYNTLSPLSKKSRLENNVIVEQPDIVDSLIGKNIYKSSFRENMVDDTTNFIFVYSTGADYGKVMGKMNVVVNIVVPNDYNNQEYDDEDRNVNIAMRIADMLDEYTIDSTDDIYDDVGSVKFELIRRDTERLAKSNGYICYYMLFEIDFVSMR